jgi:hypothetical protein
VTYASDTDAPPEKRRQVRHHPVIGFQYIPGTRLTLPRPGGGFFELCVNSAGIRSNREYSFAKPPGVYRILAFGDSHAAGHFQSGDGSFSSLIEQRNPGVEVVNFSLGATGTDQQLLTFEEIGCEYDHDLVMLLPSLSNIRRNLVPALVGIDPVTGRTVLRPKPWFELVTLEDGTERLELRNVPVPDDRLDEDAVAEALYKTDPEVRLIKRIKHALDKLTAVQLAKKVIFPLLRYDPDSEYKDPDSYEWRLMAAIIRRFALRTRNKPLVIVPLFGVSHVRYSLGRSYWTRFDSLSDGERVHAIDVLPHFLKLGRRATDCFLEPADPHPSDLGQSVLADAIAIELRRRNLLPVASSGAQAAGCLQNGKVIENGHGRREAAGGPVTSRDGPRPSDLASEAVQNKS